MELVADDTVFASVRSLVEAGEYLDNIPGAEMLSPTAGSRLGIDGGQRRRLYQRGTSEYLDVRQAGLLERLPALLPAPAEAVEEAEELIGYRLPSLLRRLYLDVGNGGFGPGYGMLGLSGGHRDDTGRAALGLYREARESRPFLPASLLPVCYWGCGIYSFIDCSQPQGPMWGWDPNPGPTDRQALFPQPLSLADWLDRWVRCELYQPTLVLDPESRQWRGATDQEYAQWVAEMADPEG